MWGTLGQSQDKVVWEEIGENQEVDTVDIVDIEAGVGA